MKLQVLVLKTAACALIPFGLTACGGGGGGASSSGSGVTPVVGTDVTGAYRAVGVECYNNAGTALTAVATIATGYTETLVINKNAYESVTNSTGCSSRENGRIVYDSTAYTAAISNRTTTTASLATCSHTVNFTATLGSISPSTVTSGVDHNGTRVDQTFSAFKSTSTGALGLLSVIQVVGSPTDICFLVYQQI